MPKDLDGLDIEIGDMVTLVGQVVDIDARGRVVIHQEHCGPDAVQPLIVPGGNTMRLTPRPKLRPLAALGAFYEQAVGQ